MKGISSPLLGRPAPPRLTKEVLQGATGLNGEKPEVRAPSEIASSVILLSQCANMNEGLDALRARFLHEFANRFATFVEESEDDESDDETASTESTESVLESVEAAKELSLASGGYLHKIEAAQLRRRYQEQRHRDAEDVVDEFINRVAETKGQHCPLGDRRQPVRQLEEDASFLNESCTEADDSLERRQRRIAETRARVRATAEAMAARAAADGSMAGARVATGGSATGARAAANQVAAEARVASGGSTTGAKMAASSVTAEVGMATEGTADDSATGARVATEPVRRRTQDRFSRARQESPPSNLMRAPLSVQMEPTQQSRAMMSFEPSPTATAGSPLTLEIIQGAVSNAVSEQLAHTLGSSWTQPTVPTTPHNQTTPSIKEKPKDGFPSGGSGGRGSGRRDGPRRGTGGDPPSEPSDSDDSEASPKRQRSQGTPKKATHSEVLFRAVKLWS